MRHFFEYFGFNRLERYGFTILIAIVILVLLVPYGIRFFRKNAPLDYELVYFEGVKGNQEGLPVYELTGHGISNKKKNDNAVEKRKKISYFFFDPNGLSVDEWAKLGFTAKQIQVIKNYEAKGGRFNKKEDVAKIYVISDRDYNRIAPYIRIKKTDSNKTTEYIGAKSNYPIVERQVLAKRSEVIYINEADTTVWKSLRGIGSVFANRIVNYREALGGFVNIDQVAEVYGLPEETMRNIRPYLLLDHEFDIRKLNINSSTLEALARHPYISKKQAQTIVNYRQQHGYFKNVESLKLIQSFDTVFLRKIEKYLEY